MDSTLRKMIYRRSGGRCEAVVVRKDYSTRCFNQATEIHHMLTRSRGGVLLDNEYEMYHLIHLCLWCHDMCDGGDAYEGGLLIDGYVSDGPTYSGTDEYLTKAYGVKP